MFTLALTFIACVGYDNSIPTNVNLSSLSQPYRCRQVEMPWDGSIMQCMLFGQVEAARWTNENPGWVLTRGWKCQAGRPV